MGALKAFTREPMAREEHGLTSQLDCVAVDRWAPSARIFMSFYKAEMGGRRDLIIAREFIARGFRLRASVLATEWLGERTEREIKPARIREVNQERRTSLERQIQNQAREGVIAL
jgi:type IV secretory pathway VirD2 relaxase